MFLWCELESASRTSRVGENDLDRERSEFIDRAGDLDRDPGE